MEEVPDEQYEEEVPAEPEEPVEPAEPAAAEMEAGTRPRTLVRLAPQL